MYFNPQDHYFKQAKKEWYKARSAFKLDEIDKKYHIFDNKIKTVMDIGCAPWSRLQYTHDKLSVNAKKMRKGASSAQRAVSSSNVSQDNNVWQNTENDTQSVTEISKKEPYTIVGFDIKDVDLKLPWLYTYNQDIQDTETIKSLIAQHGVTKFDAIISDMAPNTIGFRDIDAMRSIELLRMTLPLYEQFLKEWGKAVIKIFMWPGFDEFVADFKKLVWGKNVKTYKPPAVRKESKEIYIVKY